MQFCSSYSSLLLVIISVEKFIALYFPFKTKTICTVRIAKRVSLVTAIIYLLLAVPLAYVGDTLTDAYGIYCDYIVSPVDKQILLGIYIAILYSYGPFVIMLIANFAIIYKFISAKYKSRQGSNSESTNKALSKSAMNGTAMLLTVSFAFIILTAPIALANALYKGSIPSRVYESLLGIEYVNHGINAVLYCISGSRFRNELKKIICCFKENSSRSFSTNMTNSTASSAMVSTSNSAVDPVGKSAVRSAGNLKKF